MTQNIELLLLIKQNKIYLELLAASKKPYQDFEKLKNLFKCLMG